MTKQQKNQIDNLYNLSNKNINREKEEKRKVKEREQRIKQRRKQKDNKFDIETETVINMTNRNHQRKKQQSQQKQQRKPVHSKGIKQQAKIERKKKKTKKIFKFFILFIIIVSGIVFAMVSPIFNIQEIQVFDNNQVSSDTVISLSGLEKGQNLFKFIKYRAIEKIQSNPYVEEVNIKRKLPNKVQISIKERERNFNVEFLNEYFYMNNQGYILEISEEKLENLPVIQGISTKDEQIVEGNRLDEEDLEKLEIVLQIMNICKNYELDQKISGIDITDKTNYILTIDEENKTIYLGDDSNLSNKMLYVTTILEENKDKKGTIYVNGNINDNFKPRFKENVEV